MDWNALLSTVAIVVFIFLMMRGCGGMMAGGGCGMGVRHRHGHQPNKPRDATNHASHSGEAR